MGIFDVTPDTIYYLIVFVVIMVTCGKEYSKEEKRKESIAKCVKKHKLNYKEEIDEFPSHFEFKIRRIGDMPKYQSVITGHKYGYKFITMDYFHKVYRGKGWGDSHNTLCLVSNPDYKHPSFYVRDQHKYWDYLGKLLWGQDIDFEDDELFSKMFVLQGEKEAEIKRLFNQEVRAAFLKNHKEKHIYEFCKDTLAIFVPEYLDSAGRDDLVEHAVEIFNALNSSQAKINESDSAEKAE